MQNLISKSVRYICCIICFSVFLSQGANSQETVFSDQSTLGDRGAYKPGMSVGGITLDDSDFYEIPTEQCKAESKAKIIDFFWLTSKVFILKTDQGFIVANLDLSLRDLETGVQRSSAINKNKNQQLSCKLTEGIELSGEIDCKGARIIKKEPYEGCAYDIKVWAHSLSETQAYKLAIKKLQEQFVDYKSECVIQKKTSIKDRMIFN